MPLNLQVNDGDFTPFIKYNAKAGRWYIRQDGVDGDIEVMNPVLAFDMANIKTGWIFYNEGVGPEKVWDPSPGVMAAKPAGPRAFKRGFEVIVYGQSQNIGLREFSSTAGSMISPVLQMYDEYEKGAAANPGKVPVFACVGVKPITGKHGTNYSPMFKLQSWVERSRIPFDGQSAPAPSFPPSSNGVLTWEQALLEVAKVGLTKDKLIAELKFAGRNGYQPSRDTPLVYEVIKRTQPVEQERGFEEEMAALDQQNAGGEIPFSLGWVAALLLPFLTLGA